MAAHRALPAGRSPGGDDDKLLFDLQIFSGGVTEVSYDYNRAAFRSVCNAQGIHGLAMAYCSCILIELGLKQHLLLTSSTMNGGHDLPQLIQRLGHSNSRYIPACNALQRQLSDLLRSLYSQGSGGLPRAIPSNSYPHLRYLRHSSNWPTLCNSDTDITALNGLLQRIASLLRKNMGVQL
jgi:hypothetical protein